jgi:dTDP-4-dehydrorhamnose reductase
MRFLLTGAAGMLGTSLVPLLKDCDHSVLATDIRFIGRDMKKLDVRHFQTMMSLARKFRPDMILHLAAETDLEKCESDVDYAYEENFIGTQNACAACRELDIPIAYISTAGVFDGKKSTPYTEFDVPNPINVYGASKFQGERIVCRTLPNHFIVRAGWMIGGGERDKKFVSKMLSQLDRGTKRIYAVKDKSGTLTYAPAFSKVLEKIIRTKYYGTYHLACNGRATRYDVAAHILRTLGRKDVELKAVSSAHFKREYFAPRPKSEEMRNFILDLRGMNEMPQWRDALDVYLKTSFPSYLR